MSVINQMLKDLEQRRAQGFDSGADMLDDLAGAAGDDSREISSKKVFWIFISLLLVIALVAGLFFAQAWQQNNNAAIAVVKKLPIDVVAQVPQSTLEVPSISTSVEREIAAPQPLAVAVINESESELVESLQPAVPEVDPAAVVIAQPVTEKMVIDTILPTPLIATGRREIITVLGHGFVAPLKVTMEWNGGRAFKELQPWQYKVISKTEMKLHINLGTTADDWEIIIKQAEDNSTTEYKFSVIAGSPKSPEIVDEVITEDVPVRAVSVFNKTATPLTTNEQVRLTYAEVRHALQQGKTAYAKQLLRKLLLLDFTNIQARQTLATILFKEQQYDEAIEVLELGRIQHPKQVSFSLLLARIYTERGQDPAAVELLEGLEPEVASNSDYYALLAALYQRSAQYTKAASVYEKLLRVYPGRAVWWMGLGLSLQTTERKQDALSAYQKALAAQGLTAELKRFIQSQMRLMEHG